MSFAIADFRSSFKEFEDVGQYSDAEVSLYSGVAYAFLSSSRWSQDPSITMQPSGTLISVQDYGAMLFTAHHMALAARELRVAAAGGAPGDVNGPKTQKSIKGVSSSHDVASVTHENAAFWNMTRYGVMLVQLFNRVGAGGIALGACGGVPNSVPGQDVFWGLFLQ